MIRHLALTLLALTLATTAARAQSEPEYRMEIGGGLTMLTYEGDFNGSPFGKMQPAATLMLRRLFNVYSGLRLDATYGKIKGSSADVDTYYDAYAQEPYTFDRTLVDVSLTYEYNFWPYGTGQEYRGARRLTPYVFGGLGFTYAGGGEGDGEETKSVCTANLPLGLGLKYKVSSRLNVGLQWAMHFSLSDRLDGVADPYGIKSSGLFKNTDCYSRLTLSLTYSFMAKCRTCHNDRENQ